YKLIDSHLKLVANLFVVFPIQIRSSSEFTGPHSVISSDLYYYRFVAIGFFYIPECW
ncbi:hypothetical protein L9F63_011150, partial [Diploptera punctata]